MHQDELHLATSLDSELNSDAGSGLCARLCGKSRALKNVLVGILPALGAR